MRSDSGGPIETTRQRRFIGGLRRLVREPLLQFLVIGIALFGADRLLRSDAAEREASKRIELTTDDIRQLSVAWLAQGRPAPTQDQLKSLVEQKVALEIMVREAKDLGLDKDDEVVKRRLAQKMDFLFEDVAKAQDPSEADLKAWYAKNTDRFTQPPRIDFHHLYFALDHGRSEEQAEAAKARIVGRRPDEAVVKIAAADPFMFQDAYTDVTPEGVAKEFGPGFAKEVFALPKGSWQGPVQSGYGWHLVYVDAMVPGTVSRFEEVAPRVKVAYLDDNTRDLKRKAFEELRGHYTVVTPPLDDPSLLVPPSSSAPAPAP